MASLISDGPVGGKRMRGKPVCGEPDHQRPVLQNPRSLVTLL
ncbi:MAG: hypothetical protein OXG37_16775 [Actinomycetia bacterium]|nr:hypothetical protein [Actinomycetes bacterium]